MTRRGKYVFLWAVAFLAGLNAIPSGGVGPVIVTGFAFLAFSYHTWRWFDEDARP